MLCCDFVDLKKKILMPKAQETILEINLGALTHNFNYLKSKLQPETKFLAVVKAFAYGSDSVEIAKHLQKQNVDYFAVAYAKEGVILRDAGITTPILVLHPQPINR
jgi:alanine racemase